VDPELEAFKTQIDLREYAAGMGYEMDRSRSCRSSTMMRRGADKVSICKLPNGHYVYYSFSDDRDNGSIIDFVQRRKGTGLGELRKELRPWLSAGQLPPAFPELVGVPRDQLQVHREFAKMRPVSAHDYLTRVRCIPESILEHDRFAARIYTDWSRNAIFPHYNEFPHFDSKGEGNPDPCGFEIKNLRFTGFAKGGSKGLWTSVYCPGLYYNDSIVVCESAIDALSHAALFPRQGVVYVSIAGDLSAFQAGLITSLTMRVEPDLQNFYVIAAMDADDAGAELIDRVLTAAERSSRRGLQCFKHVPEGFKDWNERLVAERGSASR
jgi:hypothetical protein